MESLVLFSQSGSVAFRILGHVFYNSFVSAPVLATKLYIPPTRSQLVPRPRLIQRLNEGWRNRPGVTLISAPAGFGKTTLLSEWINQKAESNESAVPPSRVTWLSLDQGDNDPSRFLT